MQLNESSEAKRSRVSVHILNLLVVLFVTLGLGGCRNDTNKNGSTQQTLTEQTASPSPRPSPSTSPEILPPADTIIIIKDGSVDIEVNMTLCRDVSNPSHPDTSYRCDNVKLDKMEIKTTGGIQTNPNPQPTSKITVDGGGDKAIVVKGNPDHVKIDFKKTHYPVCGSQPGKYCGTNNVGVVTMDTPAYNKRCNPAEKCEITIKK
jgi:hypothetical protein